MAKVLAAPAQGTQAYTRPVLWARRTHLQSRTAAGTPRLQEPRLTTPAGGPAPRDLCPHLASQTPAFRPRGEQTLPGWAARGRGTGQVAAGRVGRPEPPPLTDGGDVRGMELVVGEAAQQAGLAHPGVPDQQQPEQHIVLLRHGGGEEPGLRRAAGSAPLGRCHRGARLPGTPRARRKAGRPRASPARRVPGSAARRERGGRREPRPPPAPAPAPPRGEGAGSARRARGERRPRGGGEAGARSPPAGCAAREGPNSPHPLPPPPTPFLPGTRLPGKHFCFSADILHR